MKLPIFAGAVSAVISEKKAFALILSLVFLMPITSWAGFGTYIYVDSTEVSSTETNYPVFTAHATGGSHCWYDYGLTDWNQFSGENSFVEIYTERKNSGSCYFSLANRWFALFAKFRKDTPWVRISPDMGLIVKKNSKLSSLDIRNDSSSNISMPEGWFFLANNGQFCGLTAQGRWKSYSDVTKTGIASFYLSGTLKEGCEVSPDWGLSSTESETAEKFGLESNPDEVETIKMNVGEKRTFVLMGLDSGSVWELGQCEGDVVTSDGVINKHTLRKVLPSIISLRAVRSGTETCDVIGWHYPERSKVITRRIIFNVK